jgi:hypothetical protein
VSGYKEMLKVAKELGVPEKDTVHEIRQELWNSNQGQVITHSLIVCYLCNLFGSL